MTVLVTGAVSGIGKAAARRFAEEGANVVVVDLDRRSWSEPRPTCRATAY